MKGGVCFVAGTLVAVVAGLVPIEQVQAGDIVLAGNEYTGEVNHRRVLRTFVTPDQPIYELTVFDKDDKKESFQTTGEHPFWTKEKGWVPAEELLEGDEVYSIQSGWLRVSSGTWTKLEATVYNFEVEEYHTYFVGDNKIWVHNNPCAQRVKPGRGLATEANEAVLWSGIHGGDKTAASWVSKHGGSTLETTMASRGIKLPAWDPPNVATVSAWKNASAEFAAGARGNVRVLQSDSVRLGNVWAEIEFPALKANPNVTSITAVNPNNGAEVRLWSK